MILLLENLPDIITVKELADFLKTSNQTISRALKANKLKGFKVNKEWRIEKKAVLQWIDAN